MNTNQTLVASALLILASGFAVASYGLRYTPIGGDGISNPVLVWDRWQQKVCQVSFADHAIYCAEVRPH